MRRLAAFALLGLLAACSERPPSAPNPDLSVGAASQAPIYLVTFRDDVRDVQGAAAEFARRGGFTVRHVREFAARGFSAVIPPPFADAIRADPRVLIVERDGPVSLVKPIVEKKPGGGSGGGQQVPWGITRVGGPGNGAGKTAWIIDTGVDLDHPDLTVDVARSVSFNGRTFDDQNGHGTHVAGIIAAKDNTIGVVGVAAGATVVAVRVLNAAGSGTWEAVINGVNYVAGAARNGDVANMSLGGPGSNATLEKAIYDASQKGIRFALAAGNEGDDANLHTPARVNGPNIYTVSATDSQDCMPYWSNYGNPPVDFAAPGVSILSLYKGGGTATMSGTSMAAPHVAGILLLGTIHADGNATCDPDGHPDPIAHR
jgi:subtilisin family serine protease